MNTNRPYTCNYNSTANPYAGGQTVPNANPNRAANAGYAAPKANGYQAPNAQHYAAPQAPRYAAPKTKVKVPGRAGAIARLVVMYLMAVIGIISAFGSIFAFDYTIGQFIVESIGGIGLMFLLGAWFWIIMKWVVFIAPKSLGWAKSFWRAWHPFTFFGLYIKAMIFVVVLIAPISIGTLTYMPLTSLTFYFADHELTFFLALGLFFLGFAFVAVFTFLDVCKLKGWSVKGAAKVLFHKVKLVFAGRKQ